MVANLGGLGVADDVAVVAGASERDVHDLPHRPRRGAHHDDAVGEEHRLVHVVGDQDRGGAGGAEDAGDVLLQPAPGERAPEISVTLITDFAESPPPTIEPPARCKPVNPMGRHRIAVGGKVEANTVLARIEVSAKVVVWAAPGEAPPAEMSRRTWILPVESAEKQEKRYEKLQDGK